MLHWLRNRKGRNLQQFWVKLLSVSLVAHGLVFITIFFIYKDDACRYNMTVNSKNLRRGGPIIFMPFRKVVNAHRINGSLATCVGAVKTTTVGLDHRSGHVRAEEKKAGTTVVSAAKEKQGRAKKLKAKEERAKKLKEKKRLAQEQEKQARAEKKKRDAAKKKEKEEEVKPSLEKPVEKPVEKTQPIEPQKPTVPQKEEKVAQEPTTKELEVPQVVQTETTACAGCSDGVQGFVVQGESAGEIDPLYVGQVEMEELARQDELQHEVSQYWKPPVGLREGLSCELIFAVDGDGKAMQVTVQKSSGVLVYDMAARMAVAHMQMPLWARGKELSITFI